MAGPLKLGAQALAVMGVGILASLLGWNLTHQTPPPKVGAPAPAFSLHRLTGDGDLSLRSFRGKTVVLNFFASWCGPCRREAVLLSRAAKQQRGRVVFLAAAVHDYIPDAKRFLRAQRLPFAAVTAPATLVRSFGLIGLPETFFLDARGRVRTAARGELTASELARGLRRLGGR